MGFMTYITLALFFPVITLLFWGVLQTRPLGIPLKEIYIFLKFFYIVLFILWVHKFISRKLIKLLGLEEEDSKPDEDFFTKQIDNLFA